MYIHVYICIYFLVNDIDSYIKSHRLRKQYHSKHLYLIELLYLKEYIIFPYLIEYSSYSYFIVGIYRTSVHNKTTFFAFALYLCEPQDCLAFC